MKKLFGTDGIRGEAGKFPLDRQTVEIIGASLTRQLSVEIGRAPRLIIGRDTRQSGAWIEESFAAGAEKAGAHCESAAVITTPGIAFLTGEFGFDAGIVISASHNPFEDNGIKIFTPSGRKIAEAMEREIEKDIYEAQMPTGGNQPKMDGAVHSANDFQAAYLDYLTDVFRDLDLRGFKMVLDCANGAAAALAPALFKRFGAEIVSINDAPDGVNINENCGSLHLHHLQEKVTAEKADFGVAFDGDADRALFVDEQGNIVDGDAVLWMMAKYLHADGKLNNQTVVATVMSNIGLEIALNSRDLKLLRTDVGDKYVLAEILRSESSIGGEQSGHIIFPHHGLVGDGMLTTLFLLAAVRAKKQTLSQMRDGFQQFPQILVNVKVREKLPFETVEPIARAAERIRGELGDKGRLLLRYSGTENLARVMIEGEHQHEIETQARELAAIIESSLGTKKSEKAF